VTYIWILLRQVAQCSVVGRLNARAAAPGLAGAPAVGGLAANEAAAAWQQLQVTAHLGSELGLL
jgi:hypothetical protein